MYQKFSVIDPGKCAKCKVCLAAEHCPRNAIEREEREDPPFVNQLKCKGCITCIKNCPYNAVRSA